MNITIISSSIREGRTSHRVALALEKAINGLSHEATILDLKACNFALAEERLANLKYPSENHILASKVLKDADAIIIVTPEYNGSITAALKNVLDIYGKPEFGGKAIGVATVSLGAMGGIRAAYQLQQIILGLYAYPLPQMLLTGEVTKQLDENGVIGNNDYNDKLHLFLNSFINFAGKVLK